MRSGQKDKLADIEGVIHHQTAHAIRFSKSGEDSSAVWLPKSLVEVQPLERDGWVEVTMPEWLAMDKGLI